MTNDIEAAARAVIEAWDSPESHDPDAAVEVLRSALAHATRGGGGIDLTKNPWPPRPTTPPPATKAVRLIRWRSTGLFGGYEYRDKSSEPTPEQKRLWGCEEFDAVPVATPTPAHRGHDGGGGVGGDALRCPASRSEVDSYLREVAAHDATLPDPTNAMIDRVWAICRETRTLGTVAVLAVRMWEAEENIRRALPAPAPDAMDADAVAPYAYVVVDRYDNVVSGAKINSAADNRARLEQRREDKGERSADGPYRVVPLYARPTPPPATGEAERCEDHGREGCIDCEPATGEAGTRGEVEKAALPTRGDVGRPELTRDPVFLLRWRPKKVDPGRDRWHVEGVWFTREEAEQFAKAHAYRWGSDQFGPCWHVYCVPADGEMARLLKAVTIRALPEAREGGRLVP